MKFKPGVKYGNELRDLLAYAKESEFALPAVNVINSNSVNAVLETAKKVNSPVIIQFSNGGAQFFAGKGLPNDMQQGSIAGGISGAHHVHQMADAYGVPVILHTDHAALKLLPWIDGLLEAGKAYHQAYKRPLFSSHMLDLSEEPLHENIEISASYFREFVKLDMAIEIELGVTGGEEDGVDNSDVENSKLYTQPEDVAYAFKELQQVGDMFTVAAAFGNVHGVYKPGNVELRPEILNNSQRYIETHLKTGPKPVYFVFHGGSGSPQHQIREAIGYGAIKMNIDTDTQYAFTRPVVEHMFKNYDGVLKIDGEVGNKKAYDPRAWGKVAEAGMAARVVRACEDLRSTGTSLRK